MYHSQIKDDKCCANICVDNIILLVKQPTLNVVNPLQCFVTPNMTLAVERDVKPQL